MITANIILAFINHLFLFIKPTEGKKDTLLSIEPGLIIWTIVIFIILLFILKKFAWKPLLNSLNNREEQIKQNIDRAEKLKQESEQIFKEHQEKIKSAEHESRRILNEGKELADKLRNDILNKSNEEARRIIQQAKVEIEREKQAALNSLKDEIGNLAILAAGKIIDENLDKDKQQKIIDTFIKQIPKN